MKTGTKVIFVLAIMGLSLGSYAQQFDYTIRSTELTTIKIRISRSALKISGGSSKGQIILRANVAIREKGQDSRAEGLKTVTPWPENTGLGFHISEEGGVVSIIKADGNVEGSYEISIPSNANIEIEETEWRGGSFDIENLSGNIKMESNTSDIALKGVSGSILAKSTSGQINVDLKSLRTGHNYKISTVSGTIKVIIPEQAPLNLKLETISGAIHTDFELKMEKEYKGSTLRRIGNLRKAETNLNGGGDLLKVSSVSGLVNVSFSQ